MSISRERRYKEIVAEVKAFAKRAGYMEKDIAFVPISAYSGNASVYCVH